MFCCVFMWKGSAALHPGQVCTEVNPRLTIRRARFSGKAYASQATCILQASHGLVRRNRPVRHSSPACSLCPPPPAPTPRPAALVYADLARAVANLALPNENEAKAVDARQEIDLRIGASFTRLQARPGGAGWLWSCAV